MTRRFPAVLLALAALLLGTIAALAQTQAPPDPAGARLDQARVELEQIEAGLGRPNLTDADLLRMRAQLDPIAAAINGVIAEAQPRYDAVKTRLDQLGPKPDEKAAPESPAVTAERTEQTRILGLIDETLRRARLLAVQADQLIASIASRRRAHFTQSLFRQSASILSPALWFDVAGDLPRDMRAVRFVFGGWFTSFAAQATPGKLATFLGFLLVLGGAFPFMRHMARRALDFDSADASPPALRKLAYALWTIVILAGLPIGLAIGVASIFNEVFAQGSDRLAPFGAAMIAAIARVAVTTGVARALLAPDRPAWRLLAAPDAAASRLTGLAIAVAITISTTRLIESLIDVTAGSVRTSVAVRGAGAVVTALLVAWTMRRMYAARKSEGGSVEIAPAPRDWSGAGRLIAWAVIVFVLGAALTGFVALAAFVVDQALWLTGISAFVFLFSRLFEKACETGLKPDSAIGHALVVGVGLRRESLDQIAVIASGSLTLLLFLGAALFALAPWGIESQDMIGYVQAVLFGVKVGGATISLSGVAGALALLLVGILATRAVQKWLDTRYLPSTQLDVGLRNSIRTSVGYVGFLVAAALALAQLGLNFERLAIVAGALSVGIGFGLQTVVGNFVSGLILLWERSIRVGDWIVVGEEQGYVRRINVRSTEIETFDRATVIMPNQNLAAGVVKNWVRTDRVGRIKIEVAVAQDSNRDAVVDILKATAKAHDLVLKIPAPGVLLAGYDLNSLRFELVCFVNEVETSGRVKSDLLFEILTRFEAAGVALPHSRKETIVRLEKGEQ